MKEGCDRAFARGDNLHVPLIIGSNAFEASLMTSLRHPAAAYLTTIPAATKSVYAGRRQTTRPWRTRCSPTPFMRRPGALDRRQVLGRRARLAV